MQLRNSRIFLLGILVLSLSRLSPALAQGPQAQAIALTNYSASRRPQPASRSSNSLRKVSDEEPLEQLPPPAKKADQMEETGEFSPPQVLPTAEEIVALGLPPLEPGDLRFPINLAAALRLSDARPVMVTRRAGRNLER